MKDTSAVLEIIYPVLYQGLGLSTLSYFTSPCGIFVDADLELQDQIVDKLVHSQVSPGISMHRDIQRG